VKQVGRELGVRYVLEGSVRKGGNRVRITAQLIDALSGTHLWADRFDGSLEDVFELQDKVAISVAGVIEPALEMAEIRRSAARPTTDLSAYDLALAIFFPITRERIVEVLGLLDQAIAIDRHYGPALAWAAGCHLQLVINGWAEEPETSRRRGSDLARQALQVAQNDPGILAVAALVLAQSGEDIGAMIGLVDRALALNPSYAQGWVLSGLLRVWAGQPDLAIEHIETSLRLSPRERMGTPLAVIGTAHFFNGPFLQTSVRRSGSEAALVYPRPSRLSRPISRPRRVLCPYGSARRSACDRHPAARHYPPGHAERSALGQARGPRAPPVGLAPGGRRGAVSQTRRLAAILAADVGVFAAHRGGPGRHARTPQGAAPRAPRSEDRRAPRPHPRA
jgi:tetratricopeptide (TPR) repeat protein